MISPGSIQGYKDNVGPFTRLPLAATAKPKDRRKTDCQPSVKTVPQYIAPSQIMPNFHLIAFHVKSPLKKSA